MSLYPPQNGRADASESFPGEALVFRPSPPLFRSLQKSLLGLVLFFLLGVRFASAQAPVEVLIVNSYHPGYAWNDGEVRGVLKSLLKEHPNLLPGIEYLDWIRNPTPEAERLFLEMLKTKYRGQKLRVLIALDDKAIDLVLAHREVFGRSIPVVFGGANAFTPERLRGQRNITGVAEAKDMAGTLDLLLRLQPNVEEIVGFHDNTESAILNAQALAAAQRKHAPRQRLRFLENWSVDELYRELGSLGPTAAVINLGSTRDRTGRLLADDADFLAQVSARCAVPTYLISEPVVPLFSTKGWGEATWSGIGGSLVASDLHGELVGKMACQILRGVPADSIAVELKTPTLLAVDWRQMKRFNLSLAALPDSTRIFHQPQSYYTIHQSKILAGLAVLALLGVAVVVLSINIILRRRAEHQNRRLATAVEHAFESIIILDISGGVLYVNPAFTQVTGQSLAATRQPDFLQTTLGVPGGFAAIAHALTEQDGWAHQLEFHRGSGATINLALVASAVHDDRGKVAAYILMGRDVTQERKLEEQVRNAQKLEAVGLLAGGVAHDFNNLLQIISGHTHLALEDETTAEERRQFLADVLEASNRAAQLTRQLLAFGRRQPLLREDVDLNDVVSNTLKMIRRVIGEHLEVSFVPGYELGNIYADRGQLEQVLMNLCVNARDAMPGGGRLTIELENTTIDEAFCQTHPWARLGRFVRLSTTDTGCGMDKATLNRIFEPFFSTKQKDKGTGLGLAVVHGIIQQHDGFIDVQSEPGRGTTFRIYFPIAEYHPPWPANNRVAPKAQRGTGTILLVEDEKGVRDFGYNVLSKSGYTVLTATNGLEAVDLFAKHQAEVRLVLMDMVMPVMNGPDAYSQISAIRAGVPVLFCSGYSSDISDLGWEANSKGPLIQKPYHPDQLLAHIAALLSEAAGTGG